MKRITHLASSIFICRNFSTWYITASRRINPQCVAFATPHVRVHTNTHTSIYLCALDTHHFVLYPHRSFVHALLLLVFHISIAPHYVYFRWRPIPIVHPTTPNCAAIPHIVGAPAIPLSCNNSIHLQTHLYTIHPYTVFAYYYEADERKRERKKRIHTTKIYLPEIWKEKVNVSRLNIYWA